MYIEFLSHELPFNIRSTVVFLTARLAGAVMTPGHTVAKHTQTLPPFPTVQHHLRVFFWHQQ